MNNIAMEVRIVEVTKDADINIICEMVNRMLLDQGGANATCVDSYLQVTAPNESMPSILRAVSFWVEKKLKNAPSHLVVLYEEKFEVEAKYLDKVRSAIAGLRLCPPGVQFEFLDCKLANFLTGFALKFSGPVYLQRFFKEKVAKDIEVVVKICTEKEKGE